MVSCGYEPSTVNAGFGSLGGILAMAKATIFNRYPDKGALDLLNQPVKPVHAINPLIQIHAGQPASMEETHA
jgi:hypothetical protein